MLLSFVIPSIRSDYLARAIGSALEQEDAGIEVVVVNDGAGKAIEDLATSFGSEAVRYIENRVNRGRSDPTIVWNQGLEAAKGDLVCLLGDDDFVSPGFAKEMILLAERHPEQSLFRARLKVVAEDEAVLYYGFSLPDLEDWDEYLYYRMRFRRPQSTCEFVARRESLMRIGGYKSFPLAWGSDDATWISLAALGGIASSNKVSGSWRQHSSNISSLDYRAEKLGAFSTLRGWLLDFIARHEAGRIEKHLLVDAVAERFSEVAAEPKPRWRQIAWIMKKASLDIAECLKKKA